jgi:long-chain acyl-CoA synthetase
MDAASTYSLMPWLGQYGNKIAHTLEAPVSRSLPAMAATAIQRFAGHTAFTTVMPNGMYGSLKFAQVGALSDAFAVYLRQVLKLDAGDRVAVQMPNCLSYPVVLLGVLKAGCVAVNTNPLYTASEMAHQFKDSGAKVVVLVDLFADKMEQVLKATDCPVTACGAHTRERVFPTCGRQHRACGNETLEQGHSSPQAGLHRPARRT